MEIEVSKTNSIIAGKRRYNQLVEHLQSTFKTKTQKVKRSMPINDTYHLSNLEKSYMYLNGAVGNNPKQITSSLKRDTRSVQAFLNNAKNCSNAFSQKNEKKGRWSK